MNADRAQRIYATTDAMVWTEEFMAVVRNGATVDEGLMIGWFANAIRTGRRFGYDAGYQDGQRDTSHAGGMS